MTADIKYVFLFFFLGNGVVNLKIKLIMKITKYRSEKIKSFSIGVHRFQIKQEKNYNVPERVWEIVTPTS